MSYKSLPKIPGFHGCGNKYFRKHFRKRRKMLLTSIYPFPTIFSILPYAKLTSYNYFVASRALNRDVSQILLFGKEIN